jgi:hypothetical protein
MFFVFGEYDYLLTFGKAWTDTNSFHIVVSGQQNMAAVTITQLSHKKYGPTVSQ